MSEIDIASLLQRNNELLEVLVKLQLGPVLSDEISDPESQKLYKLTGEKSRSKISSE